jgi:hypothetical protein
MDYHTTLRGVMSGMSTWMAITLVNTSTWLAMHCPLFVSLRPHPAAHLQHIQPGTIIKRGSIRCLLAMNTCPVHERLRRISSPHQWMPRSPIARRTPERALLGSRGSQWAQGLQSCLNPSMMGKLNTCLAQSCLQRAARPRTRMPRQRNMTKRQASSLHSNQMTERLIV